MPIEFSMNPQAKFIGILIKIISNVPANLPVEAYMTNCLMFLAPKA